MRATGTRLHGCDLRKGRASIAGQIYLITAVTRQREPLFSDLRLGRCVVMAMQRVSNAKMAETLAFVVMPDHLHWLMQIEHGVTLASVMRSVKAGSARLINKLRGCPGASVWQRGYYDRALRREEDLLDLARYVVGNPLRSGLVENMADYSLWDATWL